MPQNHEFPLHTVPQPILEKISCRSGASHSHQCDIIIRCLPTCAHRPKKTTGLRQVVWETSDSSQHILTVDPRNCGGIVQRMHHGMRTQASECKCSETRNMLQRTVIWRPKNTLPAWSLSPDEETSSPLRFPPLSHKIFRTLERKLPAPDSSLGQ